MSLQTDVNVVVLAYVFRVHEEKILKSLGGSFFICVVHSIALCNFFAVTEVQK
jgi:hypothetical protein